MCARVFFFFSILRFRFNTFKDSYTYIHALYLLPLSTGSLANDPYEPDHIKYHRELINEREENITFSIVIDVH